MKKIIKKQIDTKVSTIIICCIIILLVLLLCILYKDEYRLYFVYDLTSDFITITKAIFTFIISASLIYSTIIIRYDLFYELSFGNTKKEIYKKYLAKLLLIIGLALGIVTVVWLLLLAFYGFQYSIKFITNIYLGEYLTVYLLLNMIYFTLALKVLKKFDVFLLISLTILNVLLYFIIIKFSYYSIIILVLAVILGIINWQTFKRKIID